MVPILALVEQIARGSPNRLERSGALSRGKISLGMGSVVPRRTTSVHLEQYRENPAAETPSDQLQGEKQVESLPLRCDPAHT